MVGSMEFSKFCLQRLPLHKQTVNLFMNINRKFGFDLVQDELRSGCID